MPEFPQIPTIREVIERERNEFIARHPELRKQTSAFASFVARRFNLFLKTLVEAGEIINTENLDRFCSELDEFTWENLPVEIEKEINAIRLKIGTEIINFKIQLIKVDKLNGA